MKIEEALEYKRMAKNGDELPLAEFLQGMSKQERNTLSMFAYDLAYIMRFGMQAQEEDLTRHKMTFLDSGLFRGQEGYGLAFSPYYLRTIHADGKYFDAHDLFNKFSYKTIRPGYCFDNAYFTAMYFAACEVPCEVLCGVTWLNGAALHAVSLVDDRWIIDYNYGVVMEKDLYMHLYPLNVMERVDAKNLLDNYKEFPHVWINGYERLFCNKEIYEGLRNKEITQTNCPDFVKFKSVVWEIMYRNSFYDFKDNFRWPKVLLKSNKKEDVGSSCCAI